MLSNPEYQSKIALFMVFIGVVIILAFSLSGTKDSQTITVDYVNPNDQQVQSDPIPPINPLPPIKSETKTES
jgi:hypothetical protein